MPLRLIHTAATLIFVGWCLVAQSPAAGQVFTTVEEASADPDFLIQGEYVAGQKGMQVVARGDGDFAIVVYEGGLPGAGWDKQPPRRLDGDADVVDQLIESMGLTRIERTSPTISAQPPEGAIHLFDGSEESLKQHWADGTRRTDDGLLIQGTTTRETFSDYRLHVEFRTPYMPTASGQGRGNSGVYHQGRYETQVLDSFGLEGKDNETGGIYTVSAPDANLCLPPLSWQTYDVDFTAARFDSAGNKVAPARMSVRLNGVVVQNDVAVPGPTTAAILPETPQPGPIHLQDHGNPVRFRNIWIVPRDLAKEAQRPIVAGYERFFAGTGDTSAAGGRVLADSLGCAACHRDHSSGAAHSSDAASAGFGPNLSDVAGRVRHEYLADFIAAPHQVKPGTVMPDLWAGQTDAQRRQAAEAIAQYLVAGRPGPLETVGDQASADRGQTLFHQIGCVACHGPRVSTDGAPLATDSGSAGGMVPLGELAAKYTLDSLAAFLADPLAVRGHGRMPKLAADAAEARDLATYLLKDLVVIPSRETLRRRVYEGSWDKLPDFASLTPVAEDRVSDLDILSVGFRDHFGVVFDGFIDIAAEGEYRFRIISDDGSRVIVDGKTVVDHDGIHPATERSEAVRLAKGVFPIRIEYFEGNGQEELSLRVDTPMAGTVPLSSLISTEPTGRQPIALVENRFEPNPSLVEKGRTLFVSTGCVQCHRVDDAKVAPWDNGPAALADLKPGRGCLASVPAATDQASQNNRPVPDYRLTAAQRRSLESFVQGDSETLAPAEAIRHRLTSLNCYACHVRDSIGGPEGANRDYFATTTPEMGDEGRLPPMLTGAGDKLNDAYLARVLDQGANQRPYMKTRMPAFGGVATGDLAGWLATVDRVEPAFPSADDSNGEAAEELEKRLNQRLADGRVLAGNDGLACIKCHTFGGVGLAGIQAIDALLMPERLREDWFYRYLFDPQKYRPGTRMPASFPDGVSVVTKIADGRPHDQAAAMWKYFSQGAQAKPPAGLYPNAIVLKADTRPVIYRNFITGLSPRGIAVGYPEGVNIAWDSQTMTLAKVWKNDFVDASKHWIGRGPGAQEPLGDAVLAVDSAVAVARLDSEDQAWPGGDASKGSARFLGYRLNASGQPTFRYRIDDVVVEDTPVPSDSGSSEKTLTRTWKVTGTGKVTLRVGGGAVTPVDTDTDSDTDDATQSFMVDGAYRLTIAGGPVAAVRSGDRDELRVTVDLGDTESSAIITQQITW